MTRIARELEPGGQPASEEDFGPTCGVPGRRREPLIRGRWVRSGLGLAVAFVAAVVADRPAGVGSTRWAWGTALFLVAWLGSTLATDKYVHKYPYRYYSYLLASHAKAAAVMAALLAMFSWIAATILTQSVDLWEGFGLFVLGDLALSLPVTRAEGQPFDPSTLDSRSASGQTDSRTLREVAGGEGSNLDEGREEFSRVAERIDPALRKYVRETVPGFDPEMPTAVLDDRNDYGGGDPSAGRALLLVSAVRMNDLRRFNRFLLAHVDSLAMGGFFVCRYRPLKSVQRDLENRYGILFRPAFVLHFLWHRAMPKTPVLNSIYFAVTDGRNRKLSKAEVWGRLSYCGLRVIAEQEDGCDRLITARRVCAPIEDRNPTYYPVIGLTKVGVDGKFVTTHKLRSMYPFSEFLQKQLFDEHGLATTGKFRDDFRLTEYGPFLRRFWLDELPGLYDWLRGEIKLVGIRATSPHYLSLYPPEFIKLYVKVKPGLIPPIFDEETDGLEEITRVEWDYLREYVEAPVKTDATLLFRTLQDIVVGGVRSN